MSAQRNLDGPRGLSRNAIALEGLPRDDAATVHQQDASYWRAVVKSFTPATPIGASLRARLDLMALLAEHNHPAAGRR